MAAPAATGSPPATGLAGRIADRLALWRDRLLADPRFHRLAADLPFTRAVAHRRALALFDLCAGFVYAQVLLACVRLDLFAALADGPLTVEAIASRTGLDRDAAGRLAGAAASLGLLRRRRGGRFGLGPLGAALLGNAGLAAMIEHHALVYRDLADPVGLLKGERPTGLSDYWGYGRDGAVPDGAAAASYSALMAATQGFVQGDVLDAYDFARHRVVLDVGGGDGGFLAALARRHPAPALRLFDLPPVADLARARFAREGLSGRAEAIAGDFRTDPLPTGADLVTLVRVLHDHGDDTVARLLSAVRQALPPGGRLLVAEPLAATPGAERVGDAYFAFYLMAMGRGRPRSAVRLRAMLAEAGFDRVEERRTRRPMMTSVLVAHGERVNGR